MKKLREFELAIGSLALVTAITAYLMAPGPIAFFAGLFAAATWTLVVVQLLGRLR